MRIMTHFKSLSMALLMAALAIPMYAQQPGGPPPGGQGRPGGPGRGFQMTEEDVRERVDNLAEVLVLSEVQHKQLVDYELEFNTRMQVEFEKFRNQDGPPPDREEMRARMMKVREERDKKYEEVLTAEQLVRWKEIQEQRREQMRQQREQEGGSGEGEKPARGRGRN